MSASDAPARSRASTVLVVDDETPRRQEFALLLASAGFDVEQAADAQEAEELLARGLIGLVLIDSDMPHVDGFGLCARIRKAHGTGVYVILRTTKQRLASRDFDVDEGADDFLVDPPSDREVLARVDMGRKMKQLQEKLAETNAALALLEVTDPLTGVFNKRRVQMEVRREMDRSRRYGRPLSLLLVDIDEFRNLNETRGRAAGDRVLEEVARVIRLSTRATDTVGRFGAEEFAALLPETGRDQAMGAAEKIRLVIAQTAIATDAGTASVTVSIGIATFENNNFDSADDLIAAANAAMARAKAAGRNKCEASDT